MLGNMIWSQDSAIISWRQNQVNIVHATSQQGHIKIFNSFILRAPPWDEIQPLCKWVVFKTTTFRSMMLMRYTSLVVWWSASQCSSGQKDHAKNLTRRIFNILIENDHAISNHKKVCQQPYFCRYWAAKFIFCFNEWSETNWIITPRSLSVKNFNK